MEWGAVFGAHPVRFKLCAMLRFSLLPLLLYAYDIAALSSHAAITKSKVCAFDYEHSKKPLDLIQVHPLPRSILTNAQYPRILCFVNTISTHLRRAQAVASTWGQRCDKLIFFSNVSDSIFAKSLRFEVIGLKVNSDHDHLWGKHKASLTYVHNHFRHSYDWFYKADDDAYVIMENLKDYLRQPEIYSRWKTEPMQVGHRLRLEEDTTRYYIVERTLRDDFMRKNRRLIFNGGGPGYALNRSFLDNIVNSLPDFDCFSQKQSEMIPDDVAVSFCMVWKNTSPVETRDYQGRERWLVDSLNGAYHSYLYDPKNWIYEYHKTIGGVRTRSECCAPDSVAFHYVTPSLMYHYERQLYWCRDENSETIHDFNLQFNYSISERIADVPFDEADRDEQ
ncbi:unnamed protein product [Albugo candida]|uniref:N-acetylgalactosaminide beta-1,3-galactosyltransferase n=1 Tax=Albugo candida TaxID=65357 RepID=A0A024G2S0_9STRA|nr:unnamed protein product [Albugo candida]|eukprot:CCI40613.1 unnamed protein product [Albugo candida]